MNPDHENEIPTEPLEMEYTSFGFVPDVGLHRRGQLFYQQSSYWHLGVSCPFFVAAVVVALVPWDSYAKWVWAGFCLWTGACGVAPFFIRNRFGQTIIIHPQQRTVSIKKGGAEETIAWSDILALQLCYQGGRFKGYQLNLVWRRANGTVQRHCLLKHVVKRFVVRLARSYETLFRFKIIDQTPELESVASHGPKLRGSIK